jgi:hypothetical protein
MLHVNDMQFICYMSKDMSSIRFQVYFGVGICNLDQWNKERQINQTKIKMCEHTLPLGP